MFLIESIHYKAVFCQGRMLTTCKLKRLENSLFFEAISLSKNRKRGAALSHSPHSEKPLYEVFIEKGRDHASHPFFGAERPALQSPAECRQVVFQAFKVTADL